jgi:3-oxoacyl-(acyl-carrier-protein) synthase
VCIEGWTGPNIAFSTACSSANMALGYAMDLIRQGEVDVMLAGGFDALAAITVAGFNVMRNVSPDRCTPFDRDRRGLVLGEGAAALVLESESHARKRGAVPLAEFMGYGASSDAHHMTAPDATARGPAMAMERALRDAGITTDDVDYVNAHGTGTTHNDAVEAKAIRRVFGERAGSLAVASTKGMHGHALGATGAIEAVSMVLSIRDAFVPPTLGFREGDAESAHLSISAVARPWPVAVALSNNLGFGGNNCSVVIGKVRHDC